MPLPKQKHTSLIKQHAKRLGFEYCGISKAGFLEEEAPRLEKWLNNNMHGEMKYMENYFDKRLDPRLLVDGAKSVVSLLLNYYPEKEQNPDAPQLSKYAYGSDYHYVIKEKCKTLIDLSSQIISDATLFDNVENKTNDDIVKLLCQFKGIGRWSAEYVLLRGLGKIEMFPGDDVGASKNLQLLLHLKTKLDYQQISKITKKWYPYAGFIYFHLLLQKLDKKGLLNNELI